MRQPINFEARTSLHDLARTSLEEAREALARFIEAARQAYELLGQSADVMASAARELQEKAVQHADEHLRLSFELAQRLAEAKDLEGAFAVQSEFARQTAEIYLRQPELSRLVTQYTQNAKRRSED